ncbi:MAG: nucleotide exchange factor GrpE [Clostridiales bacterium]|nr:nucleotide exchange factor GrpE [Clostridiales bacterium]
MTAASLSEKYEDVKRARRELRAAAASAFAARALAAFSDYLPAKSAGLSKLSAVDEKIFGKCLELTEAYKEITAGFERAERGISSEPVGSILRGVTAVLRSRLSYFDELMAESENPVRTEKNRIAAEAAEEFSPGIAEACENPALAKEALLELCRKAVRAAAARLDNFEKRPALTFYMDFLKNEYGELSTIIKQQILEIEQAEADFSENPEYTPAREALSLLRELYQHMGKDLAEIEEYFTAPASETASPESFDDFLEILDRAGEEAAAISDCGRAELEEALAALKAMYTESVKKRFSEDASKAGAPRAVYHIRKLLADNEAMTDALKAAFLPVTSYFDENGDALRESRNFEIIKGIYDTIKIKTSCMSDNISLLTEISEELTERAGGLPVLSPGEEERLINGGFESFLEEEREEGAPLLSGEPGRVYKAFAEKRGKAHDSLTDAAGRRFAEYKKDYLLFEVSTYEEIMNYSVSKLAGDARASGFYEICARTWQNIEKILKINNIGIIAPKPGELFNGREHEVIMAEKSDVFKKGEIIKLMNSGYKIDGEVAVRANVIAAR